jgi:hypothetical protein
MNCLLRRRYLDLKLKSMETKLENITLNDLYKSESVRDLVHQLLSEEFEYRFDKLLKEAKKIKSLLLKPAMENKSLIREKFIIFGHSLRTLVDIKNILDNNRTCNKFNDVDNLSQQVNWDD